MEGNKNQRLANTDGRRSVAPRDSFLPARTEVLGPNRPGNSEVSTEYRSDLNNIAKKHRLKLDYAVQSFGPQHNCYWVAKAYIGGVEYGSATAADKGGAREAAAKQAVEVLENAGYFP
ncbi:hypothetical protein H0H93_005536 [Arthromyces matolae]|nr:hypothetical protein H0H93_005536 [Arthromyces matolae]